MIEDPNYATFKNTLQVSTKLADSLQFITDNIVFLKESLKNLNSDRLVAWFTITDQKIIFVLDVPEDTLHIRIDNRNSLNSMNV